MKVIKNNNFNLSIIITDRGDRSPLPVKYERSMNYEF
jgi:hypothetical protein